MDLNTLKKHIGMVGMVSHTFNPGRSLCIQGQSSPQRKLQGSDCYIVWTCFKQRTVKESKHIAYLEKHK